MLVDQYGKEINSNKPILNEIAIQTVRDRYGSYPSAGLTPVRLATIFREADQGDVTRQAELFEEMEEKDLHLAGIFQTRKLAAAGLEWEILPASASPEDKKIAAAAEEMIGYIENWDDALADMLDAVGKGFAVSEILWEISEGMVWIDDIKWVHQRRFTFNSPEILLESPRLITDANPVWGEDLIPNKFIVHKYRARSGATARGGLLRPCAYMYLFKNYDIKDWLIFNELFSVPMRIGKYTPGASPADIAALKQAVFNLGVDAAAVISDSTLIELVESKVSGSNTSFADFAGFCDRAMSKAVLGHTGSAEGTPGKLGSEDQAKEIRQDLLESDAKALMKTIRSELLAPWTSFNFGPDKGVPKFKFHFEGTEDLEKTAKVYGILVKDLGYDKIGIKHIQERFGIPAPENGEETLGDLTPVEKKKQNQKEPAQSQKMANKAEINSVPDQEIEQAINAQRSLDEYVQRAVDEAIPIFSDMIVAVAIYLNGVSDLKTASEQIGKLYYLIDTKTLSASLGKAVAASDIIGKASVESSRTMANKDGFGFPGLPFREQIDFFKAQSMTIANIAKADLLGNVKDAILRSMETGSAIADFRKEVKSIVDSAGYTALAPHHIDTIYRTNMQSAYQAGRYKQMTDPAVMAARPYWRYVSVLDGKTRPAHAAMNGKIYRHDDPVWQTWYPPNGFNCRCTVVTVSGTEMTREGWKVKKEPPSGWPDEGFGERTGRLAELLDSQDKQGIAWKERKGQPGPKELGRQLEKEITDTFWKPSPGKIAFLEERIGRENLLRTAALDSIEVEYRQIMGISPDEMYGVLRDPLDETVKVDLTSLAHAMIKRENARERYIRYFRDTIENPYEILLTEYEAGVTGKTKYRKKYIGLYREGKQEAVVITAEITKDGSVMWNAVNAKKGTMDRLRNGVEVLYGK